MKKCFLKSVLVLSVVLLSSSQVFSQWVAQTSGTTATIRNIRAVDNNVVWACGTSGVVLKTTDGGTNWALCTPTLATVTNYCVEALDANTAWVTGTVGGSADVSIWKTTDGGTTWTSQYNNPGGFGDGVRFFNANDGVYYGDPDPWPSGNWELLTTADGGTNWNRVPQTNFPPADSIAEEFGVANCMDIFGDNVWFSTYFNQTTTNPMHVYYSSDKGTNWTSYPVNLSAGPTAAYLAFSDASNGALVSLNGDAGFTTDGGATWTLSTLTGTLRGVTNIPGFNSFILIGSSGVSYYSDNFGPWTSLTTGTTQTLRCIDATANYAWAGGNSGTILRLSGGPVPVELTTFTASVIGKNVTLNWATATEINNKGFEVQRKSFEDDFVAIAFVEGHGTTQESQTYSYFDKNVIAGKYSYRLKQVDLDGSYSYSSTAEVEVKVPNKFGLGQNYPNPFNPSTTISYELAKETNVSLKVYDAIGNEVATLVNEIKAAGAYDVVFDASNLSNGVYFYKIQAGNFTATKKLILMK